jgi:hypothetical protein
VDKAQQTEAALIREAFAATQPLGLQWKLERPTARGDLRGDVHVRVRFGGRHANYIAEVKRFVQPQHYGAIVHQLAGRNDALLVTTYMNPRLGQKLQRARVQFIDAAGNAYLERPPLFVLIQGQKPKAAERREPKGLAFQPTGLQILFALLCKPELVNEPYRKIGGLAGVAHGTVGWVMPELVRLGIVVELAGRRRLNDGDQLIKRWVDAYVAVLRPKLLLERYRADRLDAFAKIEAARYGLVLGGEPAAARLTGHLRPGTATLYGDKVERRLLIDLRLRLDPDGNVDFRRRFWRFEDEQGLVPPLLIYADLLAIGDERCLETAQIVHEKYLARPR